MPLVRVPPPSFAVLLLPLLVFILCSERAVVVVLAQRLSSREDLAGLYSLRSSLGIRAREWPRKTDPCTGWVGITCRSGRIDVVDLSGFRRTRLGKRNPRFAVDGLQNLTRLSGFNSSGFALPGSIPEWFGSRLPSSVVTLDLSRSRISGDVPFSLGNVSGLVRLSLAGNFLTGGVPTSFGQLRNLTLLDLSSNRLTGTIPAVLGNLSILTVLDLGRNSLMGSVPDDLRNMKNLQVLDLGNNSFAGSLSDSLFAGFPNLQTLRLSHNNFSGSLPGSFWGLSQLRSVDASHNSFSGTLPLEAANFTASDAVVDISNNFYYGSLPSWTGGVVQRWRFFDISGNYFEGDLPFDRSGIGSVGFNCFRNATNQRSVGDCTSFYAARGLSYEGLGPPKTNQTVPSTRSSSGSNNKQQLIYILVGVFGGLFLVAVVVALLVLCLRRRGAAMARQKEISPNNIASVQRAPNSGLSLNLSAVGDSFTYDQLIQATSNFSDTNLIKHGHSGDLYHGVLSSGASVVVKRIDVRMFKKEPYLMELDFFTRASHTRLVPLLGHCLENDNENLLVYKSMPNRDLANAFYRKTGNEEEGLQSLDWITRLKIAIGVAEALCHLHHECTPPIVHSDVQASSVLLDDKFEVRLGSMSNVCSQDSEGHQNVITRFLRLSHSSEQGTSGSPYATCAYDVFCMGKVLLELVTGKLGISQSSDDATTAWLERTLTYISIYEKELLMKIVDPSLIVDEDLMEEVWAMAIVAKSCLNPRPSKRPQVKYVLKALENPFRVVREENLSNSARLKATSSRGSWNAALFGSCRSLSDIVSLAGPPREVIDLKHSGTLGSQGSLGEQSFNHKRPLKDVFPEPSGGFRGNEE